MVIIDPMLPPLCTCREGQTAPQPVTRVWTQGSGLDPESNDARPLEGIPRVNLDEVLPAALAAQQTKPRSPLHEIEAIRLVADLGKTWLKASYERKTYQAHTYSDETRRVHTEYLSLVTTLLDKAKVLANIS